MKNTKKVFFGLVLSMFVLSLTGQTNAGKILVGGSSSFGFSATTDKYKSDDGDGTIGKSLDINLSPQAGFFVMDGLAVGLQLDLAFSSFKLDGADDSESNSLFLFAPFARYYYGENKIKPFGEAAVGLGSFSSKDIDGDKESTGLFGFQAKLGVAAFMNDNVAIDLGIGFSSNSQKAKENNDNDLKRVSSGIVFEVGVSVIL